MSTTLIAFVSTHRGAPKNVESVVLESQSSGYGIRRADTGEVVVPAGTPLNNPTAGVYTLEVTDPAQSLYYECALKVTRAVDLVTYIYFRRYVPASPFDEDAASSSASESDSESDAGTRRISLARDALEKVSLAGYGDMFKLKITASDALLMPLNIFVHQTRPPSPRDENLLTTDFLYIATPFDATIYPNESPDLQQWPGFYRKNTVEVVVPSSELADFVWQTIYDGTRALVAAYRNLDYLELREEVSLDGSGDATTVFSADESNCETYAFAAGEQQAALDHELDLLTAGD